MAEEAVIPPAPPDGGTPPPASTEPPPATPPPAEPPPATPPAPVVPESYTFATPEGFTLDQALMDKATPIFKELGLTQESGQKLADLFQGIRASEAEAFKAQQEDWKNRVINDKEIGGQKLEETLAVANTVLAKFASPEEIKELQSVGLANHPVLVRLLYKARQEDKAVLAPANQTEDTEEAKARRMFPNSLKTPA